MLSIEIFYIVGYFIVDYNIVMVSFYFVMFYDDIIVGNIDFFVVCIVFRFNGNVIVFCIKCIVRDKNVCVVFRVVFVWIWVEIFIVYVVNGDVFVKYRVN